MKRYADLIGTIIAVASALRDDRERAQDKRTAPGTVAQGRTPTTAHQKPTAAPIFPSPIRNTTNPPADNRHARGDQ